MGFSHPFRRDRLEGNGEAAAGDQRFDDSEIDTGGRQIRGVARAQAVDGTHQRLTIFAQQPDVIDGAIRRQSREIGPESFVASLLVLVVFEVAGDRQRLCLHLTDDHAVDRVGGEFGPVGFARDKPGNEPRLVFGLLDQRVAREIAHRQGDAHDCHADARGNRDDQASREGQRRRPAMLYARCQSRARGAVTAVGPR